MPDEISNIPFSAISGPLDNFTVEDMQRVLDELPPHQAEVGYTWPSELQRLWGLRPDL